ncbi:MAG: alpha/beta hydrolase [Actinomycetota bacterium]
MEIGTRAVTANDVSFALLECGEGPLAMCVHGFPDSAHTWRHLLPELASAGYHAVAPFIRGCAPTALPVDGMFQIGAHAADLNALHEVLGGDDRAVLVGHDLGAPVAVAAAASDAERWARLVTMAVPPGPAFGTALVTDLDQLKRSWYTMFFQHPLADTVLAANDFAFIDMLWADWSPGFDAADDIARGKDTLRPEGHLAAALGFYRAAFGDGPHTDAYDAIETAAATPLEQPTLHLHGALDGCIGAEVAELARTLSPWVEVEVVDDAGHFLHLERPAEINARILEHIADRRR